MFDWNEVVQLLILCKNKSQIISVLICNELSDATYCLWARCPVHWWENTEQCESHNTRVISMSNRAKNNLSTIGYHWHVVCPMIDALKPKCKSDGTWLRFTFVNRYNMPICCIISHRELDARARFSFRWPLTTTMEQSKSGNILHHGINRMDGCEIYHEQWTLKIKKYYMTLTCLKEILIAQQHWSY